MSTQIDNDYIKFKKEIVKSNRPLYKIEGNFEPIFKKHHKSTYTIALILTKLKKSNVGENKIIFLAEILSDLLTISKISIVGFETPSLIILRRLIENFYNHIYYFDHQIEYAHLNAGRNEYTPIEKLKLYFDSHPVFFNRKDPAIKEYNQLLFNEYQELCKVAHSKGKDAMNLAKCLKDLRQEFEIKDFFKRIINIELYIIYLIYKFHNELIFTAKERNLIIVIIPANKRNHLTE